MVDDEDDDWAPLGAEQLAMRPGEVDASRARFQEKIPPSPAKPESRVAPAPARPLDPLAEQLVRDMQRRLAAAGRSDNWTADAQRREDRLARQRVVAEKVASELEDLCVVGTVPESLSPVLEVATESDMDPRELEPWFGELPEVERARLRRSWSAARHKFDFAGKMWRRRLCRAAAYGALCFVLTGLLMSFLFMDLWVLSRCALVGPFAGVAALLIGGGRFSYGLLGLLGFVVAMGSGIMMPFALYGMLFCVATMAALGMDGEMRRSAGCRDD